MSEAVNVDVNENQFNPYVQSHRTVHKKLATGLFGSFFTLYFILFYFFEKLY